MTIKQWLAMATADAEKRGLPHLVPALEGLAKATQQLRAADWNASPSTRLTAAAAAVDLAHSDDDN
jgi:hypothetical protein